MRADLFSRIVSAIRFIVAGLLVVSATACKTEKAPDQPTILGIPPATAYLGVEYDYNFGAYGGEAILDYSLTNAPSWLALEDTSNKARQGIIIRGVPGLSGGNRGEADLGKQPGINLVTTDGQMSGVQPFDINVKYNPLSVEATTFTEGEDFEVSDTQRERCEVPNLGVAGEHSFTVNDYEEDGSVTGTKEVTVATSPVLVKVILDQPSVTRVAVAFELTSQYDAANCDTPFSAPHQRCDQSEANVGNAAVGQDIIALGSGSDGLLDDIDYLTYQLDDAGVYSSGVITFEPGITECYIRLEVADDRFPERSESAQLRLTEVRSGLAGLGPNNGGAKTTLVIEDNEPTVTFETVVGGLRDTLNVGSDRAYVAVLSGERTGVIRAKLGASEGSEASLGEHFVIERREGSSWVENDELVFPKDVDEVPFRIRVPADSYSNPEPNDRYILLGLDKIYQAGRESYARADDENVLRVSLNEQTSALLLNDSDGFVATDLAIAHDGRAFVSGYDSLDNDRVRVRIYSQKGSLLQDIAISDPGDSLENPQPVIGTIQRKVTVGNNKVDRFEFAVSYSTDAAVAGTSEQGGQDVITTRYWFDEETSDGEYIENWTIRTGTDSDDIVRSVAINADSGYVSIAGETSGVWPKQTSAGRTDSFLQRIDTELDGDDQVPKVAWTRQIGSAADDSVAGGSAVSASPLLFGSAPGSVNGESVIGGVDAFFFRSASAEGNISVNQVGSDANDPVADGVYLNGQLWLLGTSMGDYSVLKNDDAEGVLERSPLNSFAGFLLAYSSSGLINQAFTINDEGDQSRERFEAVAPFDSDMVVGGATAGLFSGDQLLAGEQGILARISLVKDTEQDENSLFRNEWRYQLPRANSELLALSNYREDEIVALAKSGSDWLLLIFSPEGTLLSALD